MRFSFQIPLTRRIAFSVLDGILMDMAEHGSNLIANSVLTPQVTAKGILNKILQWMQLCGHILLRSFLIQQQRVL